MTETKKSTNSQTEHSKKLRGKTANAHRQKRLKSGEAKAISIVLDQALAARFDILLAKFGQNRVQAIKGLCDHFGIE